jgi:hypothetical protein
MATDVFLFPVPSDTDPKDVRLRDPTIAESVAADPPDLIVEEAPYFDTPEVDPWVFESSIVSVDDAAFADEIDLVVSQTEPYLAQDPEDWVLESSIIAVEEPVIIIDDLDLVVDAIESWLAEDDEWKLDSVIILVPDESVTPPGPVPEVPSGPERPAYSWRSIAFRASRVASGLR